MNLEEKISLESLNFDLEIINNKINGFSIILKQVNDLKKEKKLINSKIKKIHDDNLPFEDRFNTWFYKRKGEITKYLPSRGTPIRDLMMYFNWSDERRYKTFEFSDDEFFEGLFCYITDTECFDECFTDEYPDVDIEHAKVLIYAAAEYIMSEDLLGFENDW